MKVTLGSCVAAGGFFSSSFLKKLETTVKLGPAPGT